jgi:quercetin dioxygenase-like cupin family protein
MRRTFSFVAIAAVVFAIGGKAGGRASRALGPKEDEERDIERIKQNMPMMDGSRLTATLVEVIYPPGVGSEPHSHPCPVIGYVIEGTIESQVKGQPLQRYEAGETFYEPANGVHAVSRNPRTDKPARLLAYFLCDKPGPLDTPPRTGSGGE